MFSIKEKSYAGLQDKNKCAYCYKENEKYKVVFDSANCEMPELVHCLIKFEYKDEARTFKMINCDYSPEEFDVFVKSKLVEITPKTKTGKLLIDCKTDKQLAIYLTKHFRAKVAEVEKSVLKQIITQLH